MWESDGTPRTENKPDRFYLSKKSYLYETVDLGSIPVCALPRFLLVCAAPRSAAVGETKER